jgi:hypothetical protein
MGMVMMLYSSDYDGNDRYGYDHGARDGDAGRGTGGA